MLPENFYLFILKTWPFLLHVFLMCFRQEDFGSDGVFFLKEEGRLCAAGKCMSHPGGWAAHWWLRCSAIWSTLPQLTGLIVYFLWLCSFSVLSNCLISRIGSSSTHNQECMKSRLSKWIDFQNATIWNTWSTKLHFNIVTPSFSENNVWRTEGGILSSCVESC